ncbi:potassium channel family protein [Streptomyces sp. NPDC090108]|uniref:potassium channel family protein n=1 Tax=Streptomyces sp. NPDC090108 TaxID=3365947 RepID=UPI003811D4BF
MDDDSRTRRWRRRTDLPLAAASLVYLGAYAVHVLAPGLPRAVHLTLLTLSGAAWAFFIVDFLVCWRLTGGGLPRYVWRHRLDAVVVVLPLLRPVRILRTYEAVERRHGHTQLPIQARVMLYAGMSAALLGFAGALLVYEFEHDAPDATIRTFGDSVWWVCSTLSTVGYGDVVPVTPKGRIVAVVMMICGLALLGAVTGSFSSWLMQRFAGGDASRPDADRAPEDRTPQDGRRPPGSTPGA